MDGSPFPIRGVVEGFYGVYYTFPERNDLIRFLGRHGFNTYIYGPKNDRQHRMRWWEPYPPAIMAQFARTVAAAREAGVTFCYALSFGVPMNYASDEDFAVITAKLRAFYDRGVRAFALFLDDTTCGLHHEVNRRRYRTFTDAHVDICNRLYAWLHALDGACTLRLCPTEYRGRAPFGEYLHDLGAGLHPAIDLFYSGPHICSGEITVADVQGFIAATGRQPLLWDNYPVNDLEMRGEMHVGPIRGRDPALHTVVKGVVANTMNQPEASKIALLTYADYLRDPHAYDPWCSWERALREVGGPDALAALRRFAENSLSSCLDAVEAPELERLTAAAIAALRGGRWPPRSEALRDLAAYLDGVDEACYFLKNRMENLALRQNLLPWIECLEDWVWMGKRALLALEAMDRDEDDTWPVRAMERSLTELDRSARRIGGRALVPLAAYVLERAGRADRTHRPTPQAQPAPASHADAANEHAASLHAHAWDDSVQSIESVS